MAIQVFISFCRIHTDMVRPKISRHKVKTSITLDPDLYSWITERVESKEFANLTHAVERGIILLKKSMEQ